MRIIYECKVTNNLLFNPGYKMITLDLSFLNKMCIVNKEHKFIDFAFQGWDSSFLRPKEDTSGMTIYISFGKRSLYFEFAFEWAEISILPSLNKSIHCWLIEFISSIFFDREYPFICFSLAIASSLRSNCPK